MSLRTALLAAVVAASALTGTAALAVQPDEVLPDARQEQRARDLSAGLRCMVCQNQSIDDSDAPLARDLRLLVRERITKGDSDEDVVDYLVSRYGDFVLLRPRLRWDTVLLWGTPVLLLAIGMVVLHSSGKRSSERPGTAGLTPGEEARLSEITGEGAGASEGRRA
ncbi:cytochrome c-type biogenesis protein [Aureimonas phyllosphaerae]|uniref:Cytochrome c-type biogenesis protein n=1 Tax=Aureimonas phyllosphaerae TaxID=1166078 RepID=A0A7W6FSU6_9HYPH|nr:cytochrome c-type biogenesis protein [Aureimonas phyllosphaerae]MBB3934514.1 cytochrome c-type biogenesis protein CcmH [Aureimonas phyllosphaerae]MBB3958270.1 cytochrome c-type biogenesis protein CcmH [Aureimonas phyllosphaerae]SFE94513.1 cytochrome c-type biogenesis protein CcmH [Aureimonas phyllosphaerae]